MEKNTHAQIILLIVVKSVDNTVHIYAIFFFILKRKKVFDGQEFSLKFIQTQVDNLIYI